MQTFSLWIHGVTSTPIYRLTRLPGVKIFFTSYLRIMLSFNQTVVKSKPKYLYDSSKIVQVLVRKITLIYTAIKTKLSLSLSSESFLNIDKGQVCEACLAVCLLSKVVLRKRTLQHSCKMSNNVFLGSFRVLR